MKIIQFLVDYWQYLSIALVVIIDIILFIFKKPTKIFDTTAYASLIDLVIKAEDLSKSLDVPMSGSDKLKFVVDRYFETHAEYDDVFSRTAITCLVERILSTPTKKGGPGREKDV